MGCCGGMGAKEGPAGVSCLTAGSSVIWVLGFAMMRRECAFARNTALMDHARPLAVPSAMLVPFSLHIIPF